MFSGLPLLNFRQYFTWAGFGAVKTDKFTI